MEIKLKNRNIFLAIFLIFALSISFCSINDVSAATPLYVNGNSGNDLYDGSSATHTTGNIGPKKTIQSAITDVTVGGVVNVASGTYNEHLTVSKDVTINGASREDTFIDGSNSGRVITISGSPTISINHVTVRNGNAAGVNGGGILNTGTLAVSDCTLTGNAANQGGAISNSGTLSVSGSTLTGNTVTYAGGAIYNTNTLSVSGSTLNGNTAVLGGAIFDANGFSLTDSTLNGNHATNQGGAVYHCAGAFSITGSTLENNIADGQGGAIYNIASGTMSFNRIVGNTPTIAISGSGIDAKNNWWGTNDDPSGKVSAGVDVSQWLVLWSTANPTVIGKNGNSIITADLQHDNRILTDPTHPDLYYHAPGSGHVPDDIQVTFSTTLGSIPSPSYMVNGAAQSTLHAGSVSGKADVTSTVDGVPVYSGVEVDAVLPTAQANVKGGLYNVDKRVALVMSKTGIIYYTINGVNPTTASNKYITPILISKNTVLKFLAVDTAGNPSVIYTVNYLIDKIAPKVTSTYPKNKAKKISRTKNLSIKFSEKIKASNGWSKIVVRNKKGKKVSIKAWISGNKLYIKTLKKRSSNSYYTVYLPKYAVRDYAGNKLLTKYTFRFKTGR